MDNGSTDGSVEMVRKEFPQVKVVALPENIVTPARNEFFNHSNGEYLFCFDDDSCPESPDSISNIVSFLQRRKEVAVLTLRFWEPRTQFDGTRDIAKFSARQDSLGLRRTLFIAEGACCFRREHFGESMRYDAQNLWGAEGMDLALSLLKSGRYVYFSEQFSVLHFKHVSGRSSLHGSFWNTKHNLHVLAKHLAWYHLLILLPLHIARRAIDIVYHPGIRMAVVRGVIGSIRDFGFFYRSAKKLTTRQLLDNLPWVWFVIRGGV